MPSASALGTPTRERGEFTRICIEVDLDKPVDLLRRRAFLWPEGAKLKGNNIIPKRNISDHIENGLDIDSKSLGPLGRGEFQVIKL
ncbi:hypothetical protein D5086_002932 [Populus alba]|uniref:Uncharacterized protein n=1 Tax=Populus alba TaxID=43335 RepID=A0ACC4D2Z4_POPAL